MRDEGGAFRVLVGKKRMEGLSELVKAGPGKEGFVVYN